MEGPHNDDYLNALSVMEEFMPDRQEHTREHLEQEEKVEERGEKRRVMEFKTGHVPPDVADRQEKVYRDLVGLDD